MMWYQNSVTNLYCITYNIIRRMHKDTHWSVIAKKRTSKDKALKHFDELYKSFYKSQWPSIRVALLSERKYCAVVNNFGDSEDTISGFKKLGIVNIREVFKAELQYGDKKKKRKQRSIETSDKNTVTDSDQTDQNSENVINGTQFFIENTASLRSQLSNSEIEHDRIVKPDLSGGNISPAALHEFVPASKLKGMEDWVLESEHYTSYHESTDFPVIKKREKSLYFPQYLNIFSHIVGEVEDYPHPRRGKAGVYNYYLLDGASVLPVLALDVTMGDRVLDMCAAPGGKSYLILQTLYPAYVVSNDVKASRVKRINGVFEDYFYKLKNWDKQMNVTQRDGRCIDEENLYNKILVDVPCTNDRLSVMENDNNIFNPARIKERIRLPQLQAELLSNAIKIVRPGGTVVYSTCSLSPVQNDGVVHMALKKVWEETKIEMEVRDMTQALRMTKHVFKFASSKRLRYGHQVVPFLPNNFGPMYFCKLIKKK